MIYRSTHSNDHLWYLTLHEKETETHAYTKFLPIFQVAEKIILNRFLNKLVNCHVI